MSPKNGLCLAFGDRMTGSVSIAFFSTVQRGKKYCFSQREGEGYWEDEEKVRVWEKGREAGLCWNGLRKVPGNEAHTQLLTSESRHEESCPVVSFGSFRVLFPPYIYHLHSVSLPCGLPCSICPFLGLNRHPPS